jgi:pimeloyl-ACP methyl ester carboxylesterase
MDPDDHHIPKDIQPDNAAEIAELVADAQALADGCGERNPVVLSHMSTADVARDMDLIRASLGEDKLTYLGFSYGTLIGATYASLFPDHVRAMVLDGPLDPTLSLAKMREDQSKAFDKALDHFLDDCAKRTSCAFHSNGRPAAEFDDLMARIDKSPIPSTAMGREAVGPTLAWDAVLHSLYSSDSWPLLAYALEAANRGDASLLLLLSDPYQGRQADGTYSNLIDAYFGVMCLDFPTSGNPKAFTTLATRLVKVAPEFGRMLAYNDLPCAFWPTKAQRIPAAITAKGAPPIVVIGSTGDPATPYAWAVALDRQLASSTLVTREGEGHTSYLSDACVTKAVSPYLLTLKPPKPGLTCS